MIQEIIEKLGVEDLQEIDIYRAKDHGEIKNNPHYFKNNLLYDCHDEQADSTFVSLLSGQCTFEPVTCHPAEGRLYYYCYLPLSFSEIKTIRFDRFNDTCVMNLAAGNLFIREEMAKANMDKVRNRVNGLRDGKPVKIEGIV